MTGADLRAARLRAGVTQVQLAQEAGYSVVYLGGLETGRSRIVQRTAVLLAGAIARLRERTSPGRAAR